MGQDLKAPAVLLYLNFPCYPRHGKKRDYTPRFYVSETVRNVMWVFFNNPFYLIGKLKGDKAK